MEISPYSKKYTDLNDEEIDIWKLSYEVLQHGDRLYGTEKFDSSHLGWAIGVLLDTLRAAHKETPDKFISMFIELGISEEGYSICVVGNDSNQKDATHIPDPNDIESVQKS